MNNILKAAVRIHSLKSILNSVKKVVTINNYALQQRQLARNLWYMCSSRSDQFTEIARKLESASNKCSCGCGKHGAHTKGEKSVYFVVICLFWVRSILNDRISLRFNYFCKGLLENFYVLYIK